MQTYTHSAASTVGSSGAVLALNVTNQSDFSNGDILVMHVGFTGGTGTQVTPPAGWTLRLRQDKGTDVGLAIYTKTASSEGATWRWDFLPAASCVASYGYIVGGNHQEPLGLLSGLENPSSTSQPTPPYRVGSFGTTAISALCLSDNVTVTPPGGFTEKVDQGVSIAPKCALFIGTQLHYDGQQVYMPGEATASGAATGAAISTVVEANLGIIERFISLSVPDATTIHVRVT